MKPLIGPDGWLQTNDLGYLKEGYLHFQGRADDQINVGGIKISPDALEARIGALLGSSAGIVVAKVPDSLRGEGVLVTAEIHIAASDLRSASATALKSMGLEAGEALHVRVVPTIPRTATGKPLRRVLTEEFIKQDLSAATIEARPKRKTTTRDVESFFHEFFPSKIVRSTDSFESLGGDSLSYIQFSLGFEDHFGVLPARWESLTVEELEKHVARPAAPTIWRKLESATLARAFFMICIVALHLGTFVYSNNWGAAYFLFMLCGYSIMRFQWPEISRTGRVSTLFGTILRIVVPTVLVVAAMQLWANKFELKPLLLISNWFDPREYQVAYYYFAEIYIQLIVLVAAFLIIPAARDALRRWPIETCACFLLFAVGLSWSVEQFWDTNFLYHRTPIWYLWTIPAGMMIAAARDLRQRLLTISIIVVAVAMHHGFTSATAYIVSASALVLFIPEITVPGVLKVVVSEIAGSSMFMYLSHFQIKSLIVKLFHGPVPWLALVVAVGFGVIFSRSYHWAEGRLRRSAAANKGFWPLMLRANRDPQ